MPIVYLATLITTSGPGRLELHTLNFRLNVLSIFMFSWCADGEMKILLLRVSAEVGSIQHKCGFPPSPVTKSVSLFWQHMQILRFMLLHYLHYILENTLWSA